MLSGENRAYTHVKACVELIQARGSSILKDPLGCAFFCVVHINHLAIAVARLQSPSPIFRLWCNLLPQKYPLVLRTPLIYKTTDLCFKVREILSSEAAAPDETSTRSLKELLLQVQGVDTELESLRNDHFVPSSTIATSAVLLARRCPDWLADMLCESGAPTQSYLFANYMDAYSWMLITSA